MTELDLQGAAPEHLWLRFTRMDGYRDAEARENHSFFGAARVEGA